MTPYSVFVSHSMKQEDLGGWATLTRNYNPDLSST